MDGFRVGSSIFCALLAPYYPKIGAGLDGFSVRSSKGWYRFIQRLPKSIQRVWMKLCNFRKINKLAIRLILAKCLFAYRFLPTFASSKGQNVWPTVHHAYVH